MKKFKLTTETTTHNGVTLHRVESLKDFYNIRKGDKGGWVESENNLSQQGNCWVYDNALACGNALVRDEAQMHNEAIAEDYACLCGHAYACNESRLSDTATIGGYVALYDSAIIKGRSRIYGRIDIGSHAVIENLIINADDERVDISY